MSNLRWSGARATSQTVDQAILAMYSNDEFLNKTVKAFILWVGDDVQDVSSKRRVGQKGTEMRP